MLDLEMIKFSIISAFSLFYLFRISLLCVPNFPYHFRTEPTFLGKILTVGPCFWVEQLIYPPHTSFIILGAPPSLGFLS